MRRWGFDSPRDRQYLFILPHLLTGRQSDSESENLRSNRSGGTKNCRGEKQITREPHKLETWGATPLSATKFHAVLA